jgi:polyhydroxyalkanoate synthesis regulator phasin
MTKSTKARLTIAASVALLVGLGAAGAIAATKALSPSDENRAVLDDAASQLGVTPTALSSALKQAQKNRIDAAVAAGRLTKEQASELKQRIDSNEFPLMGPGGFRGHGPGGPELGHAGHGEAFAAAASYLGLSAAELRSQLDGKTLADVAKAKGKSVSGLVDVMVAAAEKSIDQAVSDGKLTKDQAATIKADLREHIEKLVNGEFEHFGMRRSHDGPMPWRSGSDSPPASFDGPNV